MTRKYKITLEITEEVTVLKGEEKGRKTALYSEAIIEITNKKGLYAFLDGCLPGMEYAFQQARKNFEEGKHKIDVKQ